MSRANGGGFRAERLYGRLLRLYPRRHRARFGTAMRQTFRREHARARREGRPALARLWCVTVVQAVRFGLAERLRGRRRAAAASALPAGGGLLESAATDLRFGLRLLVRSPVFTATAALSLAIGIAASTAVFALTDALMFRAGPGISEPARIVDVARTNGAGEERDYSTLSYPMFRHLRDNAETLESIAATTTLQPAPLSWQRAAGTERIFGRVVSHSFFDVLGMRPALGRFFLADEDAVPDARPVVVLSHRLWQGRLQGDPAVLSRSLRLNGTDFEVVGVAAPGFDGVTIVGTDIWVPMAMAPTVYGRPASELLDDPGTLWHRAVGRLAPGVSVAAADAELDALMAGFLSEHPDMPQSWGVVVSSSGRLPVPVRTAFAAFAGILFALTAGLLAVACSNVAAMLLARATTRRREMATRLAVGASRGQLIRQMLIETVVLFLVAAAAAIPATIWLAGAVRAFLPTLPVPVHLELALTSRSLLFAVGVAAVAGLAFGLAPARHALRTDLSRALHGRTATTDRRRLHLRRGLVIAQVALSLAMVITAGLLVRTLRAADRIDPGFDAEGVAVVSLDTAPADAVGPAAASLARRVAEAVEGVPGVAGVGYARMLPLQGATMGLGGARVPGLSEADAGWLDGASWDIVSPGYFATLRLPIVAGRPFTSTDTADTRRVAIVNEAFARVAWPGQTVVGRRFWRTGLPEGDVPYEVVGVAANAKYRSLTEAVPPFIYVPFAQHPHTRVELFVRGAGGEPPSANVRAAIAGEEPGLPILQVQPLADAVAVGLLPQRLAAWVAGLVGVVGSFLAMLGIYGLTAFLVARRTREIAVRMALGASRREVRSMVLRQAASDGAMGAGAGLPLAAGLGLAVQRLGLLVDVAPIDPLTYGSVAALMIAVLLAGCYLPTRQAVSTDPAGALRAE